MPLIPRDAPAVILDWPCGPPTGWGQYGMHFALAMHATGCAIPVLERPPELRGHAPTTAALLAGFPRTVPAWHRGPVVRAVSMGRNVKPATSPRDVALLVFEDTAWNDASLDILRTYRKVIVGSTWNREVLFGHGFDGAVIGLQGYDAATFRPAPRLRPANDGRFLVFSGGKLEFRKGQDIVIEAFKRLRKTHPEAVLVTNWWNAWPTTTRGMSAMGYVSEYDPNITLTEWAVANGIPATAFLDCGVMMPAHAAQVMRECDVAVFPNRAEGAINMVACEAIGCGVPTALSPNTGHLDLAPDANIPEHAPVEVTAVGYQGTEGWGETSAAGLADWMARAAEGAYEPKTPFRVRSWAVAAPALVELLTA